MKESVGLRANTYSYLIDDGGKDKKAKGIRKCIIKRKLKFKYSENCLKTTHLKNKKNQVEKSNINTESQCNKKKCNKFIKNNKYI